MITIAYLTNRKQPHFDWWVWSLANQVKPDDKLEIIIVDFYAEVCDDWTKADVRLRSSDICDLFLAANLQVPWQHVPVKPNVWCGPHRLTKQNWFAASNFRNTAICLCETEWLAFCDDLSVLQPGWLEAVRRSERENYFALGCYRKVRNLKVEKGISVEYDSPASGSDSRLGHANGDQTSCGGDWLYGCSIAGPLEAYLRVGGFPEICDGLSFEDVCFGIALGNTNSVSFRYDRAMLTLESEEDHFKESPFIRSDFGLSPNDQSHAALGIAKQSKYYDNYYQGGIRKLREYVLAGNPFPVVQVPQHNWFTGKHLSEL